MIIGGEKTVPQIGLGTPVASPGFGDNLAAQVASHKVKVSIGRENIAFKPAAEADVFRLIKVVEDMAGRQIERGTGFAGAVV